MAVSIPVNLKAIQNDLPKIKAQTAALNAQEKKAIKDHLSQVSFQRRLENEINRELKEQIAQRRRLTTLTAKLDRDLAKQKGGGLFSGLSGGVAGGILGAAGIGIGVAEAKRFAEEAEEAGRQLTGLQTRLRNTVGGAAEYAKAIRLGKDATQGMTSEADLASGIFTLLNARLAGNVEEAAKLSKAQNILVSTFSALGANEEKFIRLLASGNQALLDNFNLTSSAVTARQKQIEATSDLEGQEARLAAIKELVIEKADELEGSLTADEIAARQFEAASADLTATIGQSLTPAFTGAKSALADLFTETTKSIKGWQLASDTLGNLSTTQRVLNAQQRQEADQLGQSQSLWDRYIEAVDTSSGGLISMAQGLYNAATGNEEFADTYQDVTDALDQSAPIIQQSTEAIEDNTKALEDEAKRLERLADTREKSVRKLLDIDRDFQEDTQETWDDWRADQEDNFEDFGQRRNDILEKANKDAVKMQRDFAKDLSRIDRDTGRDLAKITKDENRRIRDLKENAAKEQRQEEKKRRIDAAADERLFQFDLRQMAARGNANAIQEALERREIEQQIAKEKQSTEQQIENENLQDDIARERERAAERRAEAREEAEQKKADKREEFEEEKALREEDLQAKLEQERENFIERSEELAQYRHDKLAQLEDDKRDSIQKIAEQLTEMKDVTQAELGALASVFGKFGKDAGDAFTEGLRQGFDVNRVLAGALGQDVGASKKGFLPPSTRGGRSAGFGANPGMLSFQEGGIVPGPIGQPQQATVHGGEIVINPAQGLTVNVAPGLERLGQIIEMKIGEALQMYTDEVVAPALG